MRVSTVVILILYLLSCVLYSKADFVSRVKYNNNLPDIPFDAKFITYPFESNRSVINSCSTQVCLFCTNPHQQVNNKAFNCTSIAQATFSFKMCWRSSIKSPVHTCNSESLFHCLHLQYRKLDCPIILLLCGGVVVKWLAHWTSELKVGGSTSSPHHCVVSLDKKLHSTLSLSTQVCKWAPATYCWG